MVEIKEITVTDKFGLNFLYVEFSIVDTTEDLNNYKFDLYKSYTETEAYAPIAIDIKNFNYTDYDVHLYNVEIYYYYKVMVTDLVTGEKNLSIITGAYKKAESDNYSQALMTIHTTYLNNIIKNQMLLLKRKRHGQLCPCYDSVRRRANPVDCTICYGTKYVGGYYSPTMIPVNFANSPSKIERFEVANLTEDESPVQLWTGNFPILQIEDILVDRNNIRYIITECHPSYKNYFMFRQTAQSNKILRANVIYKFPIEASNWRWE